MINDWAHENYDKFNEIIYTTKETGLKHDIMVKKMKFLNKTHDGTHNGYVFIKKGSPLYGVHYWEKEFKGGVDVHGGLTYCAHRKRDGKWYWVVGFDTCHFGDDAPYGLDWVRGETVKLSNQLYELEQKLSKKKGK